jgi:hypothetical protein
LRPPLKEQWRRAFDKTIGMFRLTDLQCLRQVGKIRTDLVEVIPTVLVKGTFGFYINPDNYLGGCLSWQLRISGMMMVKEDEHRIQRMMTGHFAVPLIVFA